jgi:hypothetical protein
VETPEEILTSICMIVAVFKAVCTLIHDSFMFNWHTMGVNASLSLSSRFCNKNTAEESIPVKDTPLGVAIQGK